MEAVLKPTPEISNWVDLPVRVAMVAHGVRIGFGADSHEALDQLTSTLPPGARPARENGVDVTYTLGSTCSNPAQPGAAELICAVNGELLIRSASSEDVLQTLERYMHLHVAEHAPRRVFVHAGVVGWNGMGVVIPGTSYSGKSSLVAALVHAGATYYSDEFAVVDAAGRVHPYLQPIQLRDALGLRDPVATAKVPLVMGKVPVKIGLVLVTGYQARARWRPQVVSAGTGMLALLANTVSARRDPKRALRNLTRMLDGARVLKGTRGEATAAVRQLIRSGYLAS